MFFSNDRNQLRQYYLDVWNKARQNLPLDPLQQLIADVLREHPEYHSLLENQGTALDTDFLPENGQSNPFLHMGMHLALREQIATNRPRGITECFQALSAKLSGTHDAEHAMMECLAEALWQSQRYSLPFDEHHYLQNLKAKAGLSAD